MLAPPVVLAKDKQPAATKDDGKAGSKDEAKAASKDEKDGRGAL